MRIALTVGHSLLENGSYTSASGEDCGGVNEYKYNKKLGTATKVKEAVKTTVSKVVNKTAYAKVVTKSDPLMIRQSANVSSKIIGKIPKKSKVEVLKKGSTWTKVKYKSVTGYSATRYLKF